MHLDLDLLITYGAVAKKYIKNEFIFYEGDPCRYFYQVHEGHIKMCWFNDEGRQFIEGLFGPGESFGEPPLFINELYPACAQAECDCIVYKLSKDTLIKILQDYPDLLMMFITSFAKRIFEKSNTNKNIISPHPNERIIGFLREYKKEHNLNNERAMIPYTRQQLADFLGLRVETVIRTLMKMEENKRVEIRKHKLYY